MSALDLVAHPIRLRIVRHLADRGPASLHELARAARVHRNTARPHVAALEDAGVVLGDTERRSGRGRPHLRYRLMGDWSPPTVDYRGLAELLAAAVAMAAIDPAQLDHLGREWGRYLAGRPGARPAAPVIPPALERLGFIADVRADAVELSACPFPLVSPRRPEIVCRLAAAAVDGVLAGTADGRCVAARSHDTGRRRCTLTLQPPGGA
jgi:predicted ArsR family transcriptional regulator